MPQQPLELILARNLIGTISLAAFLVDSEGMLVFFNTAAGELIGRQFEEVGRLPVEEWRAHIGPFDELGELIATDDLPMAQSLREGLPANGTFSVRLGDEQPVAIEATGLPLVGTGGLRGAIVIFWEAKD